MVSPLWLYLRSYLLWFLHYALQQQPGKNWTLSKNSLLLLLHYWNINTVGLFRVMMCKQDEHARAEICITERDSSMYFSFQSQINAPDCIWLSWSQLGIILTMSSISLPLLTFKICNHNLLYWWTFFLYPSLGPISHTICQCPHSSLTDPLQPFTVWSWVEPMWIGTAWTKFTSTVMLPHRKLHVPSPRSWASPKVCNVHTLIIFQYNTVAKLYHTIVICEPNSC